MIVVPSQLQALRVAIEEAASSAAASLGRSGSFPWDLRVSRAVLCCLSDFPERAVFCDEEMMASVLQSHHGGLPGTSLISLEPRHALELIGSLGSEADPLEAFRATGASVLRGVLEGIAAGGSPLEFGEPTLEENSLVAAILGTHAPPDTMVVSLEFGFVSPERSFPAYVYLLLDAKVLQRMLESLS